MTERELTDFEGEQPKSEGLGGIGADFVGTLGRRVADARTLVRAVSKSVSGDKPEGDVVALADLRRKLHAIATGAKLLKYDAMYKTLAEALAIVDGAAQGKLTEKDAALLGQMLDDLPAQAWSESRNARRKIKNVPTDDVAIAVDTHLPYTALVVGSASLVDSLGEDESDGRASFECDRTEDVQVAIDRARSLSPDVVVLDADTTDAELFVEALAEDPLTEPVPLIVVGTFARPGDAERFVAMGAAKAFDKPLVRGTLRRACERAVAQREGKKGSTSLGSPTIEELANRLADEVKRALLGDAVGTGAIDAVDFKNAKIQLGDGAEVIGAMWGAISRVREVVTARSDGAVRFSGQGPEGSIALAPWMMGGAMSGDVARSDRTARSRGASPEVRLHGRRVVVADDDPGVTWFIADLLRTAGCTVHEALDGRQALDLAWRIQPDFVISDILMPGMDGFALCRAMKRDVVLRDTPVVLLSWKEDLLQRVRELGAGAAAYMRKESDARAIVARVREVLRGRSRVEARLRAEEEVRGRLDGLTVRSLLEIVCTGRRSARISVRDASYLYEIEIREGAPQKATRTSAEGEFVRGEAALARMLGVGAGRFTVEPSRSDVVRDLKGTLFELLQAPVIHARASALVTTGAALAKVSRIVLDDDALDAYLRSTPEPTRTLVARLASGTSPRELLLEGSVDPTLLDDLLSDLASRGSIAAVFGENDADLLGPAKELVAKIQRGEARFPMPGKRSPIALRSPTPPPPQVSLHDSETNPYGVTIERNNVTREPTPLGAAVFREHFWRSPTPGPAVMYSGDDASAPIAYAAGDATDIDDAPVGASEDWQENDNGDEQRFSEGELSIPITTTDPSNPSRPSRAATTSPSRLAGSANANAATDSAAGHEAELALKKSSFAWPMLLAVLIAAAIGLYIAHASAADAPAPTSMAGGQAASTPPATPPAH